MPIDYEIVGSGLFGAICARELTDRGKKVLVIDKNSHIGGNCYDEIWTDYPVSLYGGHYFHTNSLDIWNYIQKFSPFFQYHFKAQTEYQGRVYSYPVNLTTFYQLWGAKTPQEARRRIENVRLKIDNPRNYEEKLLSTVGREVYEKIYYGYAKKHWGMEPSQIPLSLIKRIVIRYDWNDLYFNDLYQGMPTNGYTPIFEKLLDGIEVKLNTPFEGNTVADKLIYTGSIDEYFDYKLGYLDYRSVDHGYSDEEIGVAMHTYSDESIPYTRKFSYSYSHPIKQHDTFVTATEFPGDDLTKRAYPINNEKNMELYNKYKELNTDVIFGGRLGNYAYINMDQAINSALSLVRKLV